MSNGSVFLIDDSPDELELLTIHIYNIGVNDVSSFHCPFEALGKAAIVHPRVVITDFQMPAMDGVTVADRIVEMSSLTKVIIYTGIPELVRERTRKHLVLGKGSGDSLNKLFHLVTSELQLHPRSEAFFRR